MQHRSDFRFPSLDGWRGISILLVLAGHLLPIGPKALGLNGAVAASGMAIFFILSGFLITTMLLKDPDITSFLIRRFCRIIPLAWLTIVLVFLFLSDEYRKAIPHLFFIANWEPMALVDATGHFWSLCVEMQFYILIAVLVGTLRDKSFLALPAICIAITGFRYFSGVEMAINTYFRIDEILCGCILALLHNGAPSTWRRFLSLLNPAILFTILIASSHPASGILNYFRPYIALLTIAATLFKAENQRNLSFLSSKSLIYIATISYALYIVHGVLSHTWLGDGETLEKYLKRPLLIAITFGVAHISTFYFERYWMDIGRRFSQRVKTWRAV